MILYIIYKIAQVVVMALPLKFSFWLGARIADIHYLFSKKDRDLVLNNLKNVYGKVDKETKRAARTVLRDFAKYLVEFLRFSRVGREYIKRDVKVEGLENLNQALEAKKGVIIVSAHLGNWELGAALFAQLGYPMYVIALAHKDNNVNKFFINQRAITGVKNITLGGSVRRSLARLKENAMIALLCDRDFSNNAIPATFFGKTAFLPIGSGLFAVKSGCALVPVFVVRQKDDRHKVIIDKAIEYNLTGDKRRDIKDIVQKVAGVMEDYVRRYPEQWFMFGNPWKGKG